MNIKKGDNVMVIAGKDKGKKGKVTRVFRLRDRVSVEGVNMVKRHMRPRKQGEKGQVIDIATPLHISNVMLYCDKCGKGVRLKKEIKKDKKIRVCVKCNKEL